jgi:hypothetical protein
MPAAWNAHRRRSQAQADFWNPTGSPVAFAALISFIRSTGGPAMTASSDHLHLVVAFVLPPTGAVATRSARPIDAGRDGWSIPSWRRCRPGTGAGAADGSWYARPIQRDGHRRHWARLGSRASTIAGAYRLADSELYAVPIETLLRVVEGEPPGLYRGPVELIDGRVVPGILFDEATAKTHPEITASGGWREYVGSKSDVSQS